MKKLTTILAMGAMLCGAQAWAAPCGSTAARRRA